MTVVEYHQGERKEIQAQLEAMESETKLIQCDLNNATSRGRWVG